MRAYFWYLVKKKLLQNEVNNNDAQLVGVNYYNKLNAYFKFNYYVKIKTQICLYF